MGQLVAIIDDALEIFSFHRQIYHYLEGAFVSGAYIERIHQIFLRLGFVIELGVGQTQTVEDIRLLPRGKLILVRLHD